MANEVISFSLSSPMILAFPNLLTPRAFETGGKATGAPKYDATLLAKPDHPDLPTIREMLGKAALAKWPGGIPQPFEWPLKDGNALADKGRQKQKDREFFRGYLVLTARSQYAPGLSVVMNGRIKDFPMTGDERATAQPYFYGGCEVLGQFNFVPYEVGNNTPGVTAYLQLILSLNRGEHNAKLSSGGGKSGSTVYGATIAQHIGQVSSVDPTAGMPGLAGLV